MSEDASRPVVQAAQSVDEGLRSIVELTLPGESLVAPVVYEVLGSLTGIQYLLPQVCGQLAAGLGRSLDTHEVYEDDGRDPVRSVATAADHLLRAAQLAGQLGAELAHAQQAIAGQGYRQEQS